MATATKLRDDIGGFPTPGTLYRIDPPIAGADHLVLFHAPSFTTTQTGKLVVLRATPNGASFTRSVDPIDGSIFTSNPDGMHQQALALTGESLGVGPYLIVDPPVDEPEPEEGQH